MDYKVIDFDRNFIYFTADKETAYEMSAYYVHPRDCYRFYTSLEAIEELELYVKNHKKEIEAGDHHDPTALELFCEVEPDADECRVYED